MKYIKTFLGAISVLFGLLFLAFASALFILFLIPGVICVFFFVIGGILFEDFDLL